jgi:hypothetical protein
MTFSNSIFAVEINGQAIITFEAKLHTQAEEIGQRWARSHADEFPTKGSRGTDLPTNVKIRIARAEEKMTYEVAATTEWFADKKIVYLADRAIKTAVS